MVPVLDIDRPMGRASPYVPHTNGGRSPSTVTLTGADVVDALARSMDGGRTLDFSHRNLTDVGEAGAEELAKLSREDDLSDESHIDRIGLGNNRLSTLPLAFSLLTRLRYLTLRSNSFSAIPEVLTIMPSLDILDLSRNKIKRLPVNPGTLVNLRVFSLTRNKLTRLPQYLSKFSKLILLKVDQNPIEWPPRSVMAPAEDMEDVAMKKWVTSLREWLEENKPGAPNTPTPRRPSDESLPNSESSGTDPSSVEESYFSWIDQAAAGFDDGVTPHARSFSIDSSTSVISVPESSPGLTSQKPTPPPLQIDALSSSVSSSFSASPISYLPTPDDSQDSLNSADDESTQTGHSDPTSRLHGRNTSFVLPGSSRGNNLMGKKSMPDLRTARFPFNNPEKRQAHSRVLDTPLSARPSDDVYNGYSPSPLSSLKIGGSASSVFAETRPLRLRSNTPATNRSSDKNSSTIVERPAPSMDVERNSYFRRLSAMPASAIASSVPAALLTFVDAIRGILFAVSQIYQSLQHYTVYAIDERLSSILLKVLDPACTYLSQLISRLDRFDMMCRRGSPSPSACRAVVESCRDNVAVFAKALSVLALQLKVLATRDDVRYTRQMLLTFYGAMAEISNSWAAIIPHLDAVEPLLRESSPVKYGKPHSPPSGITPIAEQPESSSSSVPSTPAALASQPFPRSTSSQSLSEGRSRINRRHAGSFSAKDVQIGKNMVAAELTSPVAGSASASLTRSSNRFPLATQTPPNVPPLPSSTNTTHSSHPSPSSNAQLTAHSQQESFSTPLSATSTIRPHNLDVPSTSTTVVDKDAILAMDHAVKAAPAVWNLLEEILNDMPEATSNLRDSLLKAQDITQMLREDVKAVQDNQECRKLRENAHLFAKTVIPLLNVVKSYDSTHRLSTQLRKDAAKLTNATQEFVMLLHVSSFSPSGTPRLHTPTPGATPSPPSTSVVYGHLREETSSGSTLSRSRSVQPSPSSKVNLINNQLPRSALPHQPTFKIPPAVPVSSAIDRTRI